MAAPRLFTLLLFFLLSIIACSHELIRLPVKKTRKRASNSQRKFINLQSLEGSIGIMDYMNTQYTASIQLGSNDMVFEVIVDTGSGNLWVPDASLAYQVDDSYDCSLSVTCTANTSFAYPIFYGSGNVLGYRIVEDVDLGGLTLPQFPLFLAYVIENMPTGYFDGVMGLSLGRYLPEFPTILETMTQKGLVPTGGFSIYLGNDPTSFAETTGEIIFGGFDPKYAASDFQYISVVGPNETLFWAANMTAVGYGTSLNLSDITNFPTIFDTGSSLLVFPASFIQNFIMTARAQGIYFTIDVTTGLYLCDCSAQTILDDLVLYFPEGTFNIPASSYIMSASGICFVGMQAQPDGEPSYWNPVILGDVFLKNYYTYFVADNQTVGFATPVSVTAFPLWTILGVIFALILFACMITCLCSLVGHVNQSYYGHGVPIGSYRDSRHFDEHNYGHGVVYGGSGGPRTYPVYSPQRAGYGSRDYLH